MENELFNQSQLTIENLILKLNESLSIRKTLELEVKALKEFHLKTDVSDDSNGLKILLTDAQDNIKEYREENERLRLEIKEYKLSVDHLEVLLKDSGQALQLRGKTQKESEETILSLKNKCEALELQNAELQQKNEYLTRTLKQRSTITSPEQRLRGDEKDTTTPPRHSPTVNPKHRKFHQSVRDTLRRVAEDICEVIVRSDEDIAAALPFERREEPDPYQSNAGLPQSSRPRVPVTERGYLFGAPSDREAIDTVDEEEEEEESTGGNREWDRIANDVLMAEDMGIMFDEDEDHVINVISSGSEADYLGVVASSSDGDLYGLVDAKGSANYLYNDLGDQLPDSIAAEQ